MRLLVSIAILIITFLVLFLVLIASETALTVWHYLKEAPVWIQVGYAFILVGMPLLTLILFWNWFRPSRKKRTAAKSPELSGQTLQDDLVDSARQGVDVSSALAEIREQRRRRSSGEVFIAVYGEVSSGKSSLVKALLPEAQADSDPRAGTTTQIRHYSWQAASGDRVVISDLPGFNLEDDTPALEESRRAHLVIFLCDSDLTGSQANQLKLLRDLGKPVLLALNKSDRYSGEELAVLLESISSKTGLDQRDVVAISTGGKEEVIQLLGEDIEQRVSRERRPEIDALRNAVQRHLDQDRDLMESLRETAVLTLANEKLEAARDLHREEKASELVSTYSRRAVIGAMAAVAPGSDLVIQGVLATRLIRELSKLYDVPVKEIEIESFLEQAGGKVKNMTALTLAIAGNAFKAFPGIGTLSGGVIHAVAYGMIFDSLGKAVAETMASRGELRPYPAAEAFEELLHDHLESGAVQFAKLAVSRKNRDADQA
ncbi:MAG: 50S ribosome-binding GTPase [Xanthomonadales bacterium]|nr:50S ribosome-binding GTPase [Xanthomonadales bacterium]